MRAIKKFFIISIFIIFMTITLIFLALGYVKRSFFNAAPMTDRVKIEKSLYLFSKKSVVIGELDYDEKMRSIISYVLSSEGQFSNYTVYEYCFFWCFHISYDDEGRKIAAFETYE